MRDQLAGVRRRPRRSRSTCGGAGTAGPSGRGRGARSRPRRGASRPLRSSTRDVEPGQIGAEAGGPDDRPDLTRTADRATVGASPGARSGRTAAAPQRRPSRSVGPRVDACPAAGPASGRPAAQTLGSEPENCATPSRTPANRPTSCTPRRRSALRSTVARCGGADQLHRRQVTRPREVGHLVVALVEQPRPRPSTTGCPGLGRCAASARARRRRASPAGPTPAARRRSGSRLPRRPRRAPHRRWQLAGVAVVRGGDRGDPGGHRAPQARHRHREPRRWRSRPSPRATCPDRSTPGIRGRPGAPSHRGAGPHGRRRRHGVVLDEADHLGRSQVAVRVVAAVGETR